MFTDRTVSTRAGSLALTPSTAPRLVAAAGTVARHARDTATSRSSWTSSGCPPSTPMTTTTGTLSAHESVALSMHADGASEQDIREATGLTEAELSDLIADKVLDLPRTGAPVAPVIDVPVVPLPGSDSLQKLIEWAAAHPVASVRKSAARITAALTELSARRDSEAAQREAETRVARAREALEKAEQELRAVKAGTRTTTAATAPPPRRPRSAPAPVAPTAATSSPRSGPGRAPTVARSPTGACTQSKTVLEAYAVAHPAISARKAG
ncbi:hypothetical protein [Streptomyces sp. NPDC093105]|uniref:hypothetical protein n=1 Tax=Streptomyces sp. NPDC093105 TaxID=3366029 RepID=UPI0038180DD2